MPIVPNPLEQRLNDFSILNNHSFINKYNESGTGTSNIQDKMLVFMRLALSGWWK